MRNGGAGSTIVLAAAGVLVVASTGYVVYLRGENTRLASRIAACEASGAAARPLATADPSARGLTPEQHGAMLARLRAETGDRHVWFVTATDGEAASFQTAIRTVFEEAGWQVHSSTASFPLKPGLFFLSADEEPPTYVETALAALQAAGLEVTSGRGYRAYYTEMKASNPAWTGFDMTTDQTYVLAIGPRPPAPPPAP